MVESPAIGLDVPDQSLADDVRGRSNERLSSEKANIDPPLRSVHTSTFADILAQWGASVAVTTYQAGKLVVLRPQKSDGSFKLNTHFRSFSRPMGFVWERGRFALGTTQEIWEFHDVPAVASKLDASAECEAHDAAFVPRTCHFTGDVQIHEMVWQPRAQRTDQSRSSFLSELWFVNTRFSCLATRSDQYSFIPRWQPPFITALAPDDRCHLNGMCLRNGIVRYVTALGETDTPGGWRANKRTGGIVLDVISGEVICRGLSMVHSPRWNNEALWVLESGNGGVGFIEQPTGKYHEICRLPGFTRGLDFLGPYALVGLSQVRETATFSGIAVTDLPQEERCCGVWIVDTRNGKVVGFVKFTDAVQEIFSVQVLSGLRWPEVLSEDPKRTGETYELPEDALSKVPAHLRQVST